MSRIEQLYVTFKQAVELATVTHYQIEQEHRQLAIDTAVENIKRKIAHLRTDPKSFTWNEFVSAQADVIRLKCLDADHDDLESELLKLYSRALSARVAKANEANSKSRAGYVYIICDYERTGDYKIGRARNWQERLKQFEVKLPFKFSVINVIPCEDMFQAESTLHTRYRRQRTNGEWHVLSDSQIEELKSIKEL